jgi:hypothetical protein
MHFHLPKPLHGWRAFVGEVGIIVVGVLIALGAEQVVETIHWKNEVASERASLLQEATDTIAGVKARAAQQPCVDQQLMQLEKALLAPGPYKPVPLYAERQSFRFTYRAPARSWSDNVWRSMVGQGVTSHFDRDLQLQLAGHYSQVVEQAQRVAQADAIMFRMRVLAQPIQPDPATRVAMAAELEHARGIYELMTLVSNELLRDAEDMGFPPDTKSIAKDLRTSGTLTFCRANHFPLGTPNAQAPH